MGAGGSETRRFLTSRAATNWAAETMAILSLFASTFFAASVPVAFVNPFIPENTPDIDKNEHATYQDPARSNA